MSVYPLLDTTNNSATCNNTKKEKIQRSFTESFLCAHPQGIVCGNTFSLDLHYCLKLNIVAFLCEWNAFEFVLVFVFN